MAQTTECTLLAAEFKAASNKLYSAATAPIRMVNTLNGMIKNAALDALRTTDKMFNDLAKSLGLTAIEDAIGDLAESLCALQNCTTSIGNNPLIQAAIGADLASLSVGGVDSALKIAGHTRKYAQALAKRNALLALDKGMSAFCLGGQLGNTQMRYQQMLKSAGILDSIKLMNDIAACLKDACPNIEGFQATIDKGLADVKLNPDQTAMDIFAYADAKMTIPTDPVKKAAINDTIARGAALEAQVNNWAGGLFA